MSSIALRSLERCVAVSKATAGRAAFPRAHVAGEHLAQTRSMARSHARQSKTARGAPSGHHRAYSSNRRKCRPTLYTLRPISGPRLLRDPGSRPTTGALYSAVRS